MAILVTNGNVNLNTANGFYVSYAANFGASAANPVGITTPIQIALSFASNHTCLGVILAVGVSTTGAFNETITVELQENVASVWTTRVTATSTFSDYVAASFEPFSFGAGYAVTTAASTWRLNIYSSGVTAKARLYTSNGTAHSYVTYSNVTASFVSGTDKIVVKDKLTINQTATIAAEAGTGGSVQTSMWLCKAAGMCTYANRDDVRITWENPPVSAYTLTLNGVINRGSFTNIEIGTAANPIPLAQKATITCTAGTSSGFFGLGSTSSFSNRSALQLYGEVPTVRSCRLTVTAAAAATSLTVNDSTGFATGDIVFIGTGNESSVYTVNTVPNGTTITLTTGLVQEKKAQATICKTSGYGIEIKSSSSATAATGRYIGLSNLNCKGVYFNNVNYTSGSTGYSYDPSEEQGLIEYCVIRQSAATPYVFLSGIVIQEKGIKFKECHINGTSPINPVTNTFNETVSGVYRTSGAIYKEGVIISNNTSSTVGFGVNYKWVVDGMRYEGGNSNSFSITGVSSTVNNLTLVSFSSGVSINSLYNGTITNMYLYESSKITVISNIVNSRITNLEYYTPPASHITASTVRAFYQLVIDTTNEVLVIDGEGTDAQKTTIPGSYFRIVNEDGITNKDTAYVPNGRLVRTGTGLSDTTAYGTNTYALKFVPNNAPNNIDFTYTALIGDQANYDSYVYVWVKINNANYWAAANYQMPTLTVTYDKTSTVSAAAAQNTNWQILPISLKTLTSHPEITISVTGHSDATGSDCTFYLGQTGVVLPAGRNVDPGTLSYWSDAIPLTFLPTSLSAFDVWALNPADFGVGTVGDKVRKSLTLQQYIGLK